MHTIVLLICTTFIAQMIVGAVPPSVGGTTFVISQRQQRLDRTAIRRRNLTNITRLDRQRQQRLRQQQVRDQNRERSRRSHAASTPERLAVRQQQVRDRNRSSRANLTPEQLELRRQGERDVRASLTPERLEFRQEQDLDWHRRATAAESVRITQDVNDSNESFSKTYCQPSCEF